MLQVIQRKINENTLYNCIGFLYLLIDTAHNGIRGIIAYNAVNIIYVMVTREAVQLIHLSQIYTAYQLQAQMTIPHTYT